MTKQLENLICEYSRPNNTNAETIDAESDTVISKMVGLGKDNYGTGLSPILSSHGGSNLDSLDGGEGTKKMNCQQEEEDSILERVD